MTYERILPATFLSRPNRFIANILVDGKLEVCHVKNTGRCKELLLPDSAIYVQEAANPSRLTKYDLIAVQKGPRLVNIDSQVPNKVFREWLENSGYIEGVTLIKPEAVYGASRLDFYVEAGRCKLYAEVKGVTLEENSVAMFPDAPTERGIKHIHELCNCVKAGFEAMLVFIIQMEGIDCFIPNDRTHAEFGQALKYAKEQGVKLMALSCEVTKNSITAKDFVEVKV